MHSSGSLVSRLLAVAAAALAAVAVAAPTVSATGHHSTKSARQHGTAQPAGTLPYQNPTLPVQQRVQDLLSRMTLAEKIGQMTQAERASVDSDTSKITTDNLGSVLSGGGSVPTPNTPTAWADMVDRYQRAALATRLHIPLIYGVDTVHGDGNMYGATVFSHNIGVGATRDPALVRDVEHVAAEETRTTGPSGSLPRASASRATTAGAARMNRSARRRAWCARWRPRSTASRGRPAIYRLPTVYWPPPSISPATA
jgi:beta-glucosidase